MWAGAAGDRLATTHRTPSIPSAFSGRPRGASPLGATRGASYGGRVVHASPSAAIDTARAEAHALPPSAVVDRLEVDPTVGLAHAEARRRREVYGPNELAREAPTPAWRRFVAQFQDALVLLLLAATALSTGMWLIERDSVLPHEALAIFAIVLVNAVLGYSQEARAERALAALRASTAAHATVVRGGERQRVPTGELVPGDVILLEAGDTVPADARLTDVTSLQTDEASLTGESLPVGKRTRAVDADAPLAERHGMAFAGTVVTYGRGRAVVTATGEDTEVGRIADLLRRTEDDESPFERELDRVGRTLGIAVLIVAGIVVVAILLAQGITDAAAFVHVLLFGVALAVAAVPEGLPAIVTVVLALGVQRMARRNAIVRELAAVETLGSATVVATDKTGTLTRNEMTVRAVITASGRSELTGTGYDPAGELVPAESGGSDGDVEAEVERLLLAADRANNAELHRDEDGWTAQGDPTEAALRVAARKAGLDPDALDRRFERLHELPFSSKRQMMSTLHRDAERDRIVVFSKGAPDRVLDRCAEEWVGDHATALSAERRRQLHDLVDDLAAEALRTLAVAFRTLPQGVVDEQDLERVDDTPDEVERDLVLLGLVGMIDPPRAEAAEAVERARRAGIRTVMITGDHPTTAAAIADAVGIATGSAPRTGAEVASMTDGELGEAVRNAAVFARVSPEHKLRIVDALQRNGDVVAVTGDGVNDAPALQSGDIGVAMGITGTDVAREASDMVLTDDNFATIVAAVEQGRTIFANIRKFLRFLLSSNFGEVLTIFLAVILAPVIGFSTAGDGLILPLLATQILWINLLTDAGPALALGVDPPAPNVMERPPRRRDRGVITPAMWWSVGSIGLVMASATLLVLDSALPGGLLEGSGDVAYGRTLAFTTLVLLQLFNAFNSRSESRSAFSGLFRNRWLWGAVALSLGLQVLVVYAPWLQPAFGTVALTLGDWLLCTAAASSVLWWGEASKAVRRWRGGRAQRSNLHQNGVTSWT